MLRTKPNLHGLENPEHWRQLVEHRVLGLLRVLGWLRKLELLRDMGLLWVLGVAWAAGIASSAGVPSCANLDIPGIPDWQGSCFGCWDYFGC